MIQDIAPQALKQLLGNFFFSGARKIFIIFINIAIWKETQNVQLIAMCNIIYLSTHLLSHHIGAYLIANGSKKICDTIAYFGLIGLYLFIVFFQSNITQGIYLLFFFLGIFNGLYYVSYNITQFTLTHFKNRGYFEGLKKSLKILISTIFPALYGFIIAHYALKYGLLLGVFFFIVSYIITFKADAKVKEKKITMNSFIKKSLKNPKILFGLLGSGLFTFSFSATLFEVVSSLLIFQEVGSEDKLGFIISIISLSTAIITYLIGKLINYKHYNKSIAIVLLCYILSIYGLYSSQNLLAITIFSSLIYTWIIVFALFTSVIGYNSLSDLSGGDDYKIEFTMLREIFQVIGWISTYLVFYYSGSFDQQGLKMLFGIIIVGSFCTSILLSRVKIHAINH